MALENEKQKQRTGETVHVTIVLVIHVTVPGNGDINQQGWYGDGDDCCRDELGMGTKSENVEGMGTVGMGTDGYKNLSPCSCLL